MNRLLPSSAAKARAGEWLSEISVNNRFMSWAVIGNRAINRVIYRISKTTAADVPDSSWAEFPGDPWGIPVPWPRLYRRVGLLHVNQEAIDPLRVEYPDGSDAMAFKFDDFVMTALVDRLPDNFAMRLARGTNFVTAGRSVDGRLYVPEAAVEARATIPVREALGHVAIY